MSQKLHLNITVRRFRTAKVNRSKRFSQLVLPFRYGSIREIAIKFKKDRRRHRRFTFLQLQPELPYYLLLTVGLLGTMFFTSQVLQAQALEPTKTYSTPRLASTPKASKVASLTLPASMPTAISVPSQHINTDIIPVDQASDGSIQMPPLFSWTTGWYDKSPSPGQLGPSVIVGHVDTYRNISVFWRLRYLTPGDSILITRADKSVALFQVDTIEQFDQINFPTQKVYGNIPFAGLRLITCGGSFNDGSGSYTQNTVVFAHLVP